MDYRSMHLVELKGLAAEDGAAASHLSARLRVAADCLASLQLHAPEQAALRTQQWSVVPMVDEWGRLALLDVAYGCALVLERRLTPFEIEACTVPEQPDGVLASGAVAWTSPDVGEGRSAGAPKGWLRLAIDIRRGVAPEDGEAAQGEEHVSGLATCYGGRLGDYDRKLGKKALGPDDWVCAWPDQVRHQVVAEQRRIADEALAIIKAPEGDDYPTIRPVPLQQAVDQVLRELELNRLLAPSFAVGFPPAKAVAGAVRRKLIADLGDVAAMLEAAVGKHCGGVWMGTAESTAMLTLLAEGAMRELFKAKSGWRQRLRDAAGDFIRREGVVRIAI